MTHRFSLYHLMEWKSPHSSRFIMQGKETESPDFDLTSPLIAPEIQKFRFLKFHEVQIYFKELKIQSIDALLQAEMKMSFEKPLKLHVVLYGEKLTHSLP